MNSEYFEKQLTDIFRPTIGEIAGFVDAKYNTGMKKPFYQVSFILRTDHISDVFKMFDSQEGCIVYMADDNNLDVAFRIYTDKIEKFFVKLNKTCDKLRKDITQ